VLGYISFMIMMATGRFWATEWLIDSVKTVIQVES
jgi:peptide methionine sulfoxide reductase MsrA